MATTSKSFTWAKAPKEIFLKGDPRNPESAEHIITFPGGYLAVCRTSNNKYWVHIGVNKDQLDDIEMTSKIGTIIDGRIDQEFPNGTSTIEIPSDCIHLAFLIETEKG